MSTDKRTVSTDALETLGEIITKAEKRDAIHLAVEPARAGVSVLAGENVGRNEYGDWGPWGKLLGIVDPFLKSPVQPGEWFWLVVYPRQITSLRHVWSHPDFPEAETGAELGAPTNLASRSESENWLRNWCSSHDVPSYETILAGLTRENIPRNSSDDDDYDPDCCVTHEGEFLLSHGTNTYAAIPSVFWDHMEVVTGKKFERATHFSCTC